MHVTQLDHHHHHNHNKSIAEGDSLTTSTRKTSMISPDKLMRNNHRKKSRSPAGEQHERNNKMKQRQALLTVKPPTENTKDQAVFEKARQHLNLGRFFRFVTYVYAERKMVVFLMTHAVLTLVVWAHFGMIKYESLASSVPEDDPNYWAKRIVPPFVFGAKHAILLQMAMIPLTMSRFSIASLSGSVFDRFVPLNRATRLHIYFGWTMISLVVLATVSFFGLYGALCFNGDQEYCNRLTSEIMWTGYAISAVVLLIGLTSYFRHSIPYEVFYAVHHLLFILYIITVAHTFDNKQRNNTKQRRQTFQWVSVTLMYYLCDRAAAYMNHHYIAKLVSSSAVSGTHGSRMVILKMRRPTLFDFHPGQYAFLRLRLLDPSWHPFSIASGPDSEYLEFYIEVFGKNKSWTDKLWNLVNENRVQEGRTGSTLSIDVELMGPYGTSLVRKEEFSHALLIGTGTGVVPMLSLFNQHVRQLMRLDPATRFFELEDHQTRVHRVELAEARRKASIAKKMTSCCRSKVDDRRVKSKMRRDGLSECINDGLDAYEALATRKGGTLEHFEDNEAKKKMAQASFQATRSIYGVVMLAPLAVFGVLLMALIVSWNNMQGFELRQGMITALEVATVLFQVCFAGVAFFVWDGSQLLALIDTTVCILVPFADWFFFNPYETDGKLNGQNVARYCFLIGYMTLRFWSMTVKPRHRSWKKATHNDGAATLERLDLVWMSRSSALVSELYPIINERWEALVECWGEENAQAACRLVFYITDKDEVANQQLRDELKDTALYRSGVFQFCRPDLEKIVENYTLDLIATRRSSCSVLSFCGSPELSRKLHEFKISNDMLTAITGNKKHQMEFVSESFGGAKRAPKPSKSKATQTASEPSSDEPVSRKRDTTPDQGELVFAGHNSGETDLMLLDGDDLDSVL